MKSLWKYFHYTLNVRSRGIKSWCFPRVRLGKHQNSRENKTNWFPEGPDIKCFVIFLDFHFNSNKRITGANQNSRLGTQQHKFNSQNCWMNDLQSTFLIIICTSFCFSSGNFWDNFKNRCFLAWGFVFVLLCSFTKKKTGSVFPAFCHATFHHALITCCNVSRAGYIV